MDKKRYKILEQIGQGGMGSVFRAFDTRMNREVAIKRIRHEGQAAEQNEAAERIVQEAGALASLQHPHIVTVYDVGTDKDGPYVVMELINGKTVDELIERAPLTWPDFRELALQTQEALIGAQDRNLVHRDLKPSNLMLTWLPSGKFQVKIVDFGLAKLAEATTLGKLEEADAVFGSIYFMCPEQFERAEIDARGDLYSIGCVYYHALTQTYPFNGETGMQVMTAHLNHEVIPLQQMRPDLPRWACDWVMWHINRLPAERPQNARNSLKVFLQNDNQPQAHQPPPTQPMSTGPIQPAPEQPKRPRLIIPGAAPQPPPPQVAPEPPPPVAVPEPPRTQTAPQPLLPPEGSLPSVHHSPDPQPAPPPPPPAAAAPPPPPPPPLAVAAPPPPPPPAPAPPPAAVLTPAPVAVAVAPSRLAIGGKPAVGPALTAAPAPAALGARPGALGARPGALGGPQVGYQPQVAQAAAPTAHKKPLLSAGAKVAIAAVLGLLVLIGILFVVGKSGTNKDTEIYNRLVALAAKDDAKEVPVTKDELDVLLNAVVDVGANMQRQTVYKALFLAKATDGTDVDSVIAEFATKQMMPDDTREALIRDLLRKRKNPVVIPTLLEFCRSTGDTRAAIAAIEACRFMATDKEFSKYVEIVEYSTNSAIRQAAEANIGEILKKSPNRETLGQKIISAQATAVNDEVKYSLTRLLGPAGGAKAAEVVKKSLESENKIEQLAAAKALGAWADDTMFETLIEFIGKVTDDELLDRVFDAGYDFLNIEGRKREPDVSEDYWKMLAKAAKTPKQEMKIVLGLANNETDDWAVSVIEYFVDNSDDDKVKDKAEGAIDRIQSRARAKDGDAKEKDDAKDDEPKKDDEKAKEEDPKPEDDPKPEEDSDK
jgi:serine/threonine protein kinase